MHEPRPHVMTEPGEFRFRDRQPRAGEGKQPRAELRAVAVTAAESASIGRLYIFDYIDSWGGFWGVSSSEVAAALDELGAVDELHVHINSGGGEVYEAIAIKNLLASHPARVTAFVDGFAASAASFLAVAADETVMGENAELMIHDARTVAAGDAALFRAIAVDLDRVSDNVASIYAAKSGGDVAEWRAAMTATTWYTAEEAVTAGLADRVGADETTADETVEPDPDESEGEPVPDVDEPVSAVAKRAPARHLLNSSRAKGLAPA